jgi:endonuclease/exonuclease/phosphatase family metal-dependent hydrolase
MTCALLLAVALLVAQPAEPAQTDDGSVRVVSYNIENFRENFNAFQLEKKYRGTGQPDDIWELIRRERREDREENLEVARVILAMQPDVLALQESAGERDLAYFNKTFLDGYFETIVELPTNTDREQHLTVLLRPGFEVVRQESIADTPDVDDVNDRTDKLFARGPGFLLIRTPGGEEFWLGNTHQKSKGGNSEAVTRWRNAEAKTTVEAMLRLAEQDPDVLMVGDMNDELGVGEFETEAGGGDAMRHFDEGVVLLTKPLIAEGGVTYKGYGGTGRASLIDHASATQALAERVTNVEIFVSPMTEVASDHLPVIVDFTLSN